MFLRFLLITILGFSGIQEEKTIIFYGDSLTAGYGLAPENAFPALIDNMLGERGLAYKVVNAGVSGETSSGGLTRIDWVLNQKVDIFVLELGANDGLRGIPTEKTAENLEGIVKKVKDKNPDCQIVIVGMMVPPNMGQDYANRFSAIFPKLASSTNATLMPFLLTDVAGNPDLNLPDGIHPNVNGHKIVAQNMMKVLDPIL